MFFCINNTVPVLLMNSSVHLQCKDLTLDSYSEKETCLQCKKHIGLIPVVCLLNGN